MEDIQQFLEFQYHLVQDSRRVLFEYCSTINPQDFVKEHTSFGRGGSIRNLLVHIANTYEFWIGKWSLKRPVDFTRYSQIEATDQLRKVFGNIDELMDDFIQQFSEPGHTQIEFEINGERRAAEPLKIFTHVTTHEFHHKGQVLSISRQLGYTPVDTDIMR